MINDVPSEQYGLLLLLLVDETYFFLIEAEIISHCNTLMMDKVEIFITIFCIITIGRRVDI